ncbi:MAG: hypothetical protein JWM47_2858 [Acidimicrobiales bacterium]|nr:hypothetical protein [Acidimicrobiales bacterium]
MANKRDSTSQKRSRENRARRQALEARTKGAPVRPSRVAPATAAKLAKAPSTKGGAAASDAKGATTRSGKPRRERPPRPGDTPVDIATLEGSWYKKVVQVPGGLQVLMAAGMVVFVTLMVSFTDVYFAPGDESVKGAKASQTIFEHYSAPKAALLLGLPVLLVIAAAASSLTRHRRRTWLVAAVAMAVVFGTAVVLYAFVAAMLGWAYFRANKVEGPAEPLFRRGSRRRTDDAAGGLDDVEDAGSTPGERDT